MAVIHLFGPVSEFYRYWRISLADFIASMLAFWVTIFVSAEIGIGCAAGWSVVWTMIRSAFVNPSIDINNDESDPSNPQAVTRARNSSTSGSDSQIENRDSSVPDDTVVVHFTDSVFYPNAHRAKRGILEAIKLVYVKITSTQIVEERERSWSVAAERRVERIRREQKITPKNVPLSAVVWDFTAVPFIDVTAILALGEMKQDIRLHCGKEVQFRMFGMSDSVRQRFLRAKWKLTDMESWREEGADVVYPSLERAIFYREGGVLEAVKSTEKIG